MPQDLRLLIVDPQNDLCATHAATRPLGVHPALPVRGADTDMQRLGRVIHALGPRLHHIAVTLDSHAVHDIAHPPFWQTATGGEVAPFTPITANDVATGYYRPRHPADLPRAQRYVAALAATGRYTLMVWPVHCVVGSWGHAIHPTIQAANTHWFELTGQKVYTVRKGLNPYTEHYSAFAAEVPDPSDPETQFNVDLLKWTTDACRLLIAGEASSHCVRATVEDLLTQAGPDFAPRITLLTDCISPVVGFEKAHKEFLQRLRLAGVHLQRAQNVIASSSLAHKKRCTP
jgi:nicotinamidase-related amidase